MAAWPQNPAAKAEACTYFFRESRGNCRILASLALAPFNRLPKVGIRRLLPKVESTPKSFKTSLI